MVENDFDSELLDYEEDEKPQGAPGSIAPTSKKEVKGPYVSFHSSGFRDFLLKPELLHAIVDCGFEHPSEGKEHYCHWLSREIDFSFVFLNELTWTIFSLILIVQHECIPQAILGMDILYQAKSGMGKTAVFVLATLQPIEPVQGQVTVSLQCIHFTEANAAKMHMINCLGSEKKLNVSQATWYC